MNRSKLLILFLTAAVALTAASAALAQGTARLLPAAAGDLAAADLAAPLGLKAVDVPREPVALSWQLDPTQPLTGRGETFVARSKEYWLEASAGELRRGVPVHVTAPGALIRLNRADAGPSAAPLDPTSLVVIDPTGRAHAHGAAMELLVNSEQLRAAGAPFVEGTVAFRLRSDLGAGTFRLQGEMPERGRYVVSVFDRGSDVELTLRTIDSDYLHGQSLQLEATLEQGRNRLPAVLDGFVSSPAGRAWPVSFRQAADGAYRATLALDALETPAPGLWEAHVAGRGEVAGATVMRATRVAFNCAVPSARLDGSSELVDGDGLGVRLGVEVASDSRFELRGVLYGTAADGELLPIAVGHSADFLAAGHGALTLAFDRGLIAASGLTAPFEVRDLRLVDQGTMGLLHRQERGLVLAP